MITDKILINLKTILNDSEQVGREIYYAMSYIPENNPGISNLRLALRLLGINKPEDIGLSDSVLKKRI